MGRTSTVERWHQTPRRGNRMTNQLESSPGNYQQMLKIAIDEARQGLAEGGIPIAATLFDRQGNLLVRGHNRPIQENDPAIHALTDALCRTRPQRTDRVKRMVTTLLRCSYCSGIVRRV